MPWSPPPWMAVEGEEGKEGERVVIGLPRSLSPSSFPTPPPLQTGWRTSYPKTRLCKIGSPLEHFSVCSGALEINMKLN